MKTNHKNCLDIVVPINADANWQTKEELVTAMLKQYTDYGFTRFMLCTPIGGWRSIGYPPQEFFVEKALLFKEIKEELLPYGIELGWWECLTIKSGATEGFQPIVQPDGRVHPFANCPFGENFKNRFARDIALFAKIAKPAFIYLEDDYSLAAANGCYCDLHLKEFEKRYGIRCSREELVKILKSKTPEAVEVTRKWRELGKISLVELSEAVRKELDKESPEIPIGSMQSGGDFRDGDCTEDVCRALSGPNHTPFSRLASAHHAAIKARSIPQMLYRALYCKEHIDNFGHYLEADTYPHTRFFTASSHMMSAMAAAFSYGFDGAVFHTMQQFDNPNEETAYGKAFKRERKKFEEIYRKAKECSLKGVGIEFDPFWNTYGDADSSLWVECIARFGIPYTTKESNVLFWDETQARYSDDMQIRKALSKNLFLDGSAAKILCERGYSEYLGVSVGDEVSKKDKLIWDLAAREVICESFKGDTEGRNMFSPWMYSPVGNGMSLDLQTIDERTQAVTEIYSYMKNFASNGMTYFENELGGKVIVMGMTLKNNHSQPLFNYRRKQLIQNLIERCSDEFCFVEKAPDVMVIENVANDSTEFREMLTVINLCEDKLDEVKLHIPSTLRDFSEILLLNRDGIWNAASFTLENDSVVLQYELHHCDPMYILFK